MIATIRTWFESLSTREQYLVGIAGALSALVVLVFAIILPSLAAIEAAEVAHDIAVERRGRIEATVVNAAQQRAAGSPVSGAAIDLIVTQGAAEKGFDLIKSANTAPGQMTFRMDQARAPALFSWLAELETQGVEARSITLRGGPGGNVTVDAQLRQVSK